MRDEEVTIEYSIEGNGNINFNCKVPLTDVEVEEFKRVLDQGSSFLNPTLGEDEILYSYTENYGSEERAVEVLQRRSRSFAFAVKSRTEITLVDINLTVNIPG